MKNDIQLAEIEHDNKEDDSFDFMPDFDLNLDLFSVNDIEDNETEDRYCKPLKLKEHPEYYFKYENAVKLAKDIKIIEGDRYFFIISGSFIFGDFIEALIVENNYHIKKMIVSTLSMSENNVDSFANLLDGGFIDSLDLIVSDYFFSHERHNLVKYIYKELDKDNKFQLSVAGTHTKICIFETYCGKKIVIHGSANLRSSANIEQFVLEESKGLYDFNIEYMTKIVDSYMTIKKPIRVGKLWKTIN